MKILIVDDEPDLLEMMVESLGAEVEVVGASTVEEALEKAEGCSHALVDGLNKKGFPLALKLKEMGIKTFLFSGMYEIHPDYAAAFDGMIEKPCNVEDIFKTLKKGI